MARLTWRLKPSRVAVAVGLLAGCSYALADPVSLISIGVSALGTAGVISATTAFFINVGLSLVSASLASNAAKRQQAAAAAAQRAQYNASLQDRNVTGLSGEAPWQIVYGNPAPIGGSLAVILSSGSRSEFKHLVVTLAAHECEAIDEIYLDGEAVGTLDGNGYPAGGVFLERLADLTLTESLSFNASGVATTARTPTVVTAAVSSFVDDEYRTQTRQWQVTASGNTLHLLDTSACPITLQVTYQYAQSTPRVRVGKHLSPGGVDTVDAYLNSVLPGQWTASDKLSGYTYVVITLDLNFSRFQGGPPNVTAKVRGKKVYDYRTGLTSYSSNNALCLADFITSEAGFGATQAQIDTAAVIAAANACDAAGFSCDGSFRTEQARENTKQQLEESFGAISHQSGGVWRINAGAWTTPVMALTDADLAAPIQIEQAGYNSKERFNTVRGKYVDGAGLGVATDFTPWQNLAEVALDGLVKVKDVSFAFTKDHQRTQDLARMIVERSRGGLTITYPGQMRLWPLQPGDRVSITNAEFGWSGKTFRVTDWSFHPRTPVALQMVEDVAAYYDPAAIITADAAPNTNLVNPLNAPDLLGLSADSGTNQLLQQADGTIVPRVLLQWAATDNNYVLVNGKVQIQFRLATATDNVWTSAPDGTGDATSAYLPGLSDGIAYIIRARFVNQLGITGAWNTIAHQVVGKTAPPTAPSNVSLTQSLVFWTRVTDLDLAGYLIRSQAGTSGVFSRGTPLHTGVVTAMPFTLTQRLYGVQTIMVAAVDTSGNVSEAASATLDFGQPDSSNFVQSLDYRALGFPGLATDCAISVGDLVADPLAASDIYALADVYGEPDLYATQYAAMQWVSTPFLPAYGGGTLSLSADTEGASPSIEYRIDGDTVADLYGLADVYAEAELYGAAGSYQPWPGALAIGRMVGVQWRVGIASGSEQGKITAFTASLAAQEGGQTFANQAISSAGTRLAPSAGTPVRTWIVLRSVQITPFVDGGGAIAGRLLDFNTTVGPLAQLVNSAGTPVTGTATIDLKGLIDV